MKEAAIGANQQDTYAEAGMPAEEISAFFRRNAQALEQATAPAQVQSVARDASAGLCEMADELAPASGAPTSAPRQVPVSLENLEMRLTLIEEKLLAALIVAAPEAELAALHGEADRAI